MFALSIGIPVKLLTANDRPHWAVKARTNRLVRNHFALLARSEMNRQKIPKATGRRQILAVLVRGPGERQLDRDNAYGAIKPCLDGLKDAGLIVDDSDRWLDLHLVQEKTSGSKKPAQLEIQIEDL